MARRLLSKQGGFVHDIDAVTSLSDAPNNMRLLSDRSLYILQNLSQEDITFLSRYGQMEGGDFYLPVEPGTAAEGDVIDAIDLIRRDLNDMAVEELLACICETLGAMSEQGVSEGQDIESPPSDGEISVGEGQQFPDQASYFDAKCSASNAIFDTILQKVVWLKSNNIDLLAGLLGGVTTAVAMGLLLSGPVGWAIGLASTVVVSMSTYLVKWSMNFSDLEDALNDVHDELVLSLFNAANADTARASFVTELAASSVSTTAVERGLIGIMLANDLLNLLFDPRADVVGYVSPNPVDCGVAILQVWSFPASGEGWSFRDDSDSPYSASGAWNSGAEAWTITIVGPGTGTGPRAEGTILITGLSIAIPAGGSVQFDHGATGDGVIASRKVKAIFSDVTEQELQASSTRTAGTVVMTVPAAKTLAEIEISIGRNWSFAFNTTRDVQEVRVIGV